MKASAPALPNALACAALISIVVAGYWPTSEALWSYWTDPDGAGTHGTLVALISVWLLYRSRQRLNEAPVKPVVWLVIPLILMSVAWLVFWRGQIPALHIILFPALMLVGIAAALGWKVVRWAAFPIGFLYFAVPSWDVLIGPLQSLVVMATGAIAPLLGIHSHVSGDLLVTTVGTFEIGRGCSGVNFFAIGVAVAALLGELEGASAMRRCILVCIMAVAAIVSNWIRVLIVVDAGYRTNMQHYLVARSHYMFGWVLFSIVMFGFVWWCARAPRELQVQNSAPAAGGGATRWPVHVAVMLSLMVVPLLGYGLGGAAEAAVTPVAFRAPDGTGTWRGPVLDRQRFVYETASGASVDLTALASSIHDPGKDLATVLASLVGKGEATPASSHRISVDGLPYIETVTADSQGQPILLWSTYDIGGRRFVTPLLSRLWYGVASLGGTARPVLFAFWTRCVTSCDDSRLTLTDFAKTLGPELSHSWSRVSLSPSNQRAL